MASKTKQNEASLFDFDEDQAVALGAEVALWHEVPQARYLSWPPAMQMAYCRDRDLDSAKHAESDAWREFYADRAKYYDEVSKDGI